MSGYNLIWVFIAVVIASAAGYVLTPKGDNQTVIRTIIIMTLACCYMSWAITYLAQLHPLIVPKKTGMRPHLE
ncbi:ATPase, V0 complex, subunit E1/e2 [Zychaea mexicana]|uniref:ATPase, V0 complex, subunit E1/e2 n=1 Tax=Zychaea mexicana TaxID=64656 RepID=UPI0022FEB386|nr:ATPase, V0 complex, subunit E1/e2 [Zychaea mexicana]KAI9494646.1 ATPase, V0 complex, subunit E1/e2 [Zychaea mexicana]